MKVLFTVKQDGYASRAFWLAAYSGEGEGKERIINARFAATCSHYLIDADFSPPVRRRGASRRTCRITTAASGRRRRASVWAHSPSSTLGWPYAARRYGPPRLTWTIPA